MATVRLSAPRRREIIIRAAGKEFAKHGYAGARLEDIAAAAQVTKPIVYRHFDSKQALYLALLRKHEDDLTSFFTGPNGAPATVPDILDGWLDYVRENSHAWLMLFRDSTGDDEIRAVRRRVSLSAREVLAGFFAGQGVPTEQVEPTAEMLRSALAGVALWWIDHAAVPKAVVLEVAARVSEAALSGRPS
jgi:AcrR family transcriptional regulator